VSVPVVAVASIIQETNTFSAWTSSLADFEVQGLWVGADAARHSAGSNTEFAGALEAVAEAGAVGRPLVRAWAMSGGILDAHAFAALQRLLVDALTAEGPFDALVLCLHGALVAENESHADLALIRAARSVVGDGVPVVVTLDLHANVIEAMVREADALIGFHTYPHVDQADTGKRAAQLALRMAGGNPEAIGTVVVKRPMLLPAETQVFAEQPMRGIRERADELTGGPILDVSIFPVQPWLDVPGLGFAVTVTSSGDREVACSVASAVADAAWTAREGFHVELVALDDAIADLRPANGSGPRLLVQSADSPTAGATGDDASVIAALDRDGGVLQAIATVVDAAAVAACWDAGPGGPVQTPLGAALDARWSEPFLMRGRVLRVGDDPVVLAGESMTGQAISLGRWATIDNGNGLRVLVTERAAPTFDPQGFRHAGLEPSEADVVVVRSAALYRAGFAGLYSDAVVLDLPGASTPRFSHLEFIHAPRPLFPIDDGASFTWDDA